MSTRRPRPGSVAPLDRDRRGLAATDAEGRDAAGQAPLLERVQERDDEAGTGRPDRVAERAGAPIDVQPVARDAEIALCRHGNRREGLVDLEEVDVADAPRDLVEQLADGRDRRRREPGRILRMGRMALDSAKIGRPSRSAMERR